MSGRAGELFVNSNLNATVLLKLQQRTLSRRAAAPASSPKRVVDFKGTAPAAAAAAANIPSTAVAPVVAATLASAIVVPGPAAVPASLPSPAVQASRLPSQQACAAVRAWIQQTQKTIEQVQHEIQQDKEAILRTEAALLSATYSPQVHADVRPTPSCSFERTAAGCQIQMEQQTSSLLDFILHLESQADFQPLVPTDLSCDPHHPDHASYLQALQECNQEVTKEMARMIQESEKRKKDRQEIEQRISQAKKEHQALTLQINSQLQPPQCQQTAKSDEST